MVTPSVTPLGQQDRQPCSLPLADADLGLGNANWTKGLQAMSDWIWSANLNPVAFPNNLARYFLQIPAQASTILPLVIDTFSNSRFGRFTFHWVATRMSSGSGGALQQGRTVSRTAANVARQCLKGIVIMMYLFMTV